MNSLDTPRVATLLTRLHAAAEASDRAHLEKMMAQLNAPDTSIEQMMAHYMAEERRDYPAVYRGYADNFLAISPAFGRFLYALVRATGARRIVEFGSSMGISTLYLAAAVRDNGGGIVIGSELEPGKVAKARAHLAEAGLDDLVDIREGDALDTLADMGGAIDLALIDGALSLYLPVLKLIEPALRTGAAVIGENAFAPDYQAYVHDPANGYVSQPVQIGEARGNEFSVRIA
ncbi:class I SAM-dependent methyltransferase [Sphingomonadaceae bacterium jetA1]|uniref:O-methyltransferase n=1 Tax=Facivitalis istanbulensis TaxID=3075838 RepID=UPI00347A5F50